jgi:hypothetical protein
VGISRERNVKEKVTQRYTEETQRAQRIKIPVGI